MILCRRVKPPSAAGGSREARLLFWNRREDRYRRRSLERCVIVDSKGGQQHLTDRAMMAVIVVIAATGMMMMRAVFACQQLHKAGRKTFRAKLEKQALAAPGRHKACRNRGAQQQRDAKQQTALSLNSSQSVHWQRQYISENGIGHSGKGIRKRFSFKMVL